MNKTEVAAEDIQTQTRAIEDANENKDWGMVTTTGEKCRRGSG